MGEFYLSDLGVYKLAFNSDRTTAISDYNKEISKIAEHDNPKSSFT